MDNPFVRKPSDRSFKHGHTRGKRPTRVFRAWAEMIRRCTNPNFIAFKHYGGRGIKVCERWQSFENFLADMGEPPTEKHELDRYPNKDGDYEPDNCRWATKSENMRNTNRNHLVTYQGRTQCLAAWSEELGIPWGRLRDRLGKLGWTVDRAFNTGLH